MRTDTQLPVSEYFYSFQGEGVHAGRAAFFIRLQGCPLRCKWCDTPQTWESALPGRGVSGVDFLTPQELVSQAAKTRAEFAVITGGEPAIHDLRGLAAALHGAGLPVHLETSGAFPIRGDFDWICLSPKRPKMPLPENLARAAELKWVVESPEDLPFFERETAGNLDKPIVLQVEASKRQDGALLQTMAQWVREKGAPYRLGWQLHKLFGAR